MWQGITYHVHNHKHPCYGIPPQKHSQTDATKTTSTLHHCVSQHLIDGLISRCVIFINKADQFVHLNIRFGNPVLKKKMYTYNWSKWYINLLRDNLCLTLGDMLTFSSCCLFCNQEQFGLKIFLKNPKLNTNWCISTHLNLSMTLAALFILRVTSVSDGPSLIKAGSLWRTATVCLNSTISTSIR